MKHKITGGRHDAKQLEFDSWLQKVDFIFTYASRMAMVHLITYQRSIKIIFVQGQLSQKDASEKSKTCRNLSSCSMSWSLCMGQLLSMYHPQLFSHYKRKHLFRTAFIPRIFCIW